MTRRVFVPAVAVALEPAGATPPGFRPYCGGLFFEPATHRAVTYVLACHDDDRQALDADPELRAAWLRRGGDYIAELIRGAVAS